MHTPRRTRKMKMRLLAGMAPVCLATAVLAGCGGSSSATTQQTATQAARPTPAQSNADIGSAKGQRTHVQAGSSPSAATTAEGSTRTPHRGSGGVHTPRVQKGRPTPGSSNDGVSSSAPKALNPCTLVSTSEAQTMTGETIGARIEAPLGPTCIYRLQGSKSEITLAVQAASFSQARHHITKPTRVTIRGRQAVCGKLGTQMLLVPLGGGRYLNVTAPCAIAQRFAATALSRLTA